MIRIRGGEFLMGSDRGMPGETPAHRVRVDDFYLDETEVTNAQFAKFVEATGYITESERQGSSGVFDPAAHGWNLVEGADWRHPAGRGSSIKGREDYPAIHVSWDDAVAYTKWAGKRLPTEAEFEYAIRGGLDGEEFAWGADLNPNGAHRANIWQGVFPERDLGEDKFRDIAPVKSFPPNGYGLYDIVGNVWEWVEDWYAPDYYSHSPTNNPTGPRDGAEKVIRGGSWLCASNYCSGYRAAARQKSAHDSGLNNLGFRCAADAE